MKSLLRLILTISSLCVIGCAQKSECTRMLDVVTPHVETIRKIQNEGMKQDGASTQSIRDLAAQYRKFSTSLLGVEFSADNGAASTSSPAATMNKLRVGSGQLAEELDKLVGYIEKNDVPEMKKVQGAISDLASSEVLFIFDVTGYCQNN